VHFFALRKESTAKTNERNGKAEKTAKAETSAKAEASYQHVRRGALR
jgi:hypothetical protein